MQLHMRQYDGTTFGMETQSAAAFKKLKKNAFYGEVTPSGWNRSVKRLCVKASDLAAVMGEAAWLVSEGHYMETVRWGDSPEHYIIYEQKE